MISIFNIFEETNNASPGKMLTLSKILFEVNQDIPPEQIVTDCLRILKSKPLKERIQTLRAEIREKETKGQDPEVELNEVIKLQQELNEL